MEKVTWNKIVHQHSYFKYLVIEFMKNKPLNTVKVDKIIEWLENILADVKKEAGK